MDDYMSDEIMKEIRTAEKKSKDSQNSTLTRCHKRKRQSEQIKPVEELRRERLEEGLTTPLDHSNKGFQMLLKMGFKTGEGLGKCSQGSDEPIPLVIKQGRAGLGKDEEIFATNSDNFNPYKKRKLDDQLLSSYQEQIRNEHLTKKTILQIIKILTQVIPQLDEQKNITENKLFQEYFELLEKNSKKKNALKLECWKCGAPTVFPAKCNSCGQSMPTDFFSRNSQQIIPVIREYLLQLPEKILLLKLRNLLEYMRSTHVYCYFCGSNFNSEEDMQQFCPGITEEFH